MPSTKVLYKLNIKKKLARKWSALEITFHHFLLFLTEKSAGPILSEPVLVLVDVIQNVSQKWRQMIITLNDVKYKNKNIAVYKSEHLKNKKCFCQKFPTSSVAILLPYWFIDWLLIVYWLLITTKWTRHLWIRFLRLVWVEMNLSPWNER